MNKINWKFYPLNIKPPAFAVELAEIFNSHCAQISSTMHDYVSNDVLAILSNSLINSGYLVERGKKKDDKINVPILYGFNGKTEKSFDADAYHAVNKVVLEVEAGRGVLNNQFLKDYFQACMMIDVEYFAVAVRNNYKGTNDFLEVIKFFDALYASGRVLTQLKGVMVVGY